MPCLNHYCLPTDDAVYLEDESQRQEYVLNETGRIWLGTIGRFCVRPWNYAQVSVFSDNIFISYLCHWDVMYLVNYLVLIRLVDIISSLFLFCEFLPHALSGCYTCVLLQFDDVCLVAALALMEKTELGDPARRSPLLVVRALSNVVCT